MMYTIDPSRLSMHIHPRTRKASVQQGSLVTYTPRSPTRFVLIYMYFTR
jgi:hypothetical protein